MNCINIMAINIMAINSIAYYNNLSMIASDTFNAP